MIDDGPYFNECHGYLENRDDVINDGPWRSADKGDPPPAPPETVDEFHQRVAEDCVDFIRETNTHPTKLHVGRKQLMVLDEIRSQTWHHLHTDGDCRNQYNGLEIIKENTDSMLEVRK